MDDLRMSSIHKYLNEFASHVAGDSDQSKQR